MTTPPRVQTAQRHGQDAWLCTLHSRRSQGCSAAESSPSKPKIPGTEHPIRRFPALGDGRDRNVRMARVACLSLAGRRLVHLTAWRRASPPFVRCEPSYGVWSEPTAIDRGHAWGMEHDGRWRAPDLIARKPTLGAEQPVAGQVPACALQGQEEKKIMPNPGSGTFGASKVRKSPYSGGKGLFSCLCGRAPSAPEFP